MPLAGKSFDLDVFVLPNLQTGSASQIEAFSIQGHDTRMLKTSFEVLKFKKLEFKGFNILGPCSWMVNSIRMFFDFKNSKSGVMSNQNF